MNKTSGGKKMQDKNRLSETKMQILEQLLHGKRKKKTEEIQPRHHKEWSALSYAQQRLWFLDQLVPNNPIYNMPAVLRLKGKLDVRGLEKSMLEIVKRHEVLRTTFSSESGKPKQRIHKSVEAKMEMVDLRGIEVEKRENEVKRITSEECRMPFNLEKGPLIRAKLLVLNQQEYILIIVMHHIISDGWSLGIFAKELMQLYESFLMNSPSSLPELPIQYGDFAEWQKEYLKGAKMESQLEYWKRQLSGELPVLQLPTDYSRPGMDSFSGDRFNFTLSKDLLEQVKDLSKKHGMTLFMTLLSAYKVLLYRYTMQEDVIVGTPIAGRNRKDIEPLIGFFVNTLPLRTDLSGQPSFTDLLKRVRETALGAFSNQELPFEKLVEEIQPERKTNQTPIFQTIFVLQNAPIEELKLPNLSVEFLDIHSETSKFDLLLTTMEREDHLLAAFEYNTDLFKAETIQRMAKHFEALLESIVQHPDEPIGKLSILTDKEYKELIPTENVKSFTQKSIHVLFEEQVMKSSNKVAVVYGKESLTYDELNQQANRVARYLRKMGIRKGDYVGLCVERSLDTVVGILAILKSGGAYIPLDPNYPGDRLQLMLEDSKASVLVTQQHHEKTLPEHSCQVVFLDKDKEEILKESTENISSDVTGDDLAYVLYTSGSTGKPKGVMVKHYNVVRLFKATEHWYQFNDKDVWTMFHSYAFDFSVWEIWGALLYGGKLVVVPYDISRSPDEFLQLLLGEQVTVLNQTPSAFRQLLQIDEVFMLGTKDRLALRYIIFGGEALDLQVLRPWFDDYGDEKPLLINMYGITETTVHVTYRPISMKDLENHTGSVIGQPIPDQQVYVLDRYLQPVPVGVPGEMYVGGNGVSKGYWNRPELTEERFIPHPFKEKTKERLYKTGDLVKYRANGELEYLGRTDNQVKIRGFRIELGEIEASLSKKEGIQENIVTVYNDGIEKKLISYIVLNKEYKDRLQEKWLSDQISEWEEVFDNYYQSEAAEDPTFNIVGWNSTYTGHPIPTEEMKVWLESTVERILSLKPKHVLEIGSGTGMILYRVAPSCRKYVATDFSKKALDYTKRQLESLSEDYSHVELFKRTADNMEGIGDDVDTIILNSIVQYFPDESYLKKVIDHAMKKIKHGGTLFIGDVRSLELLEAFYASLELHHAPLDMSPEQFMNNIQGRSLQENELVISTAFFHQLKNEYPNIQDVEILPKRGIDDNELTKFRYDVIIRLSKEEQQKKAVKPNTIMDWEEEGLSIHLVQEFIQTMGNEHALLVKNIPNGRLTKEIRALEICNSDQIPDSLGDLKDILAFEDEGVHPEEFWSLEEKLGLHAAVSWDSSGRNGYFDVLFSNRERSAIYQMDKDEMIHYEEETLTTSPLKAKLANKLAPELRDYLKKQLPDFMVPAIFMFIEKIPLTPNGKTDFRALPSTGLHFAKSETNYVAPETPTEEKLTEIWGMILGNSRIGVHDNFFEIGGHSLLATQLIFKMRKDFEMDLPLRLLFEKPTISGMAEMIERIRNENEEVMRESIINVDLSKEVHLDEDIQPDIEGVSIPMNPDSIFLTGATGFLGSFLLHELLKKTQSKVYCLVRAKDDEEGIRRIQSNLEKYRLWNDAYNDRIVPVVGDLARPQLGLTDKAFKELTLKIDVIYHNGALVNFIYPYESLKAANVEGTKEVIRLASQAKIKPIHFISTLYVFPPSKNNTARFVKESDPLESSEGLRMGYTQSKWVAENILTIAKHRGIPVSIYRPGRISGHSLTGACQTNDFFWTIIKGCVQMNSYPDIDVTFEMSPVDYMAEAIVAISLQKESIGKNYHLYHKEPISLKYFSSILAKIGYSLKKVTQDEWLSTMVESNNAAQPLVNLLAEGVFNGAKIEFDDHNVAQRLADTYVACPDIDEKMIKAIVSYFIETEYLEPPKVESGL